MNKINQPLSRSGFTLLEILLVIAAIGILAAVVITAVNPTKQLGQARNAQRRVDVNTILNAVYQYTIDNQGDLPGNDIDTIATEICESDIDGVDATCESNGGVDLSALTETTEEYLVSIPIDPSGCGSSGSTCYEIEQTANGRITVSAPNAENEIADPQTISVTR